MRREPISPDEYDEWRKAATPDSVLQKLSKWTTERARWRRKRPKAGEPVPSYEEEAEPGMPMRERIPEMLRFVEEMLVKKEAADLERELERRRAGAVVDPVSRVEPVQPDEWVSVLDGRPELEAERESSRKSRRVLPEPEPDAPAGVGVTAASIDLDDDDPARDLRFSDGSRVPVDPDDRRQIGPNPGRFQTFEPY